MLRPEVLMAMVSWTGHEAEGEHNSQQDRGGKHLANREGEFEYEVFQERPGPIGPGQGGRFFSKKSTMMNRETKVTRLRPTSLRNSRAT